MDDPNITMEEYIQLMADKARGRDQTFNWETATYGKVYCEDLDSFTDFETDFPTIIYNDASTSNQNVSSEPTVSIYNAIKSDIDFHISFSDSEDEDYTFIYNKDSSSYKLIPANDLKPEPGMDKTYPGEPSEEVDNVGGVFINMEILKSFSKLKTLSLNLNTLAKSRSVGDDVVVSEAVGVGVGVTCYDRGLKNGGGRGLVVVKLDVISGITVA
ncbi:hypothetical protein Tco_1085684 [Tanacetum coccineum]